jgi:hypothetical protein
VHAGRKRCRNSRRESTADRRQHGRGPSYRPITEPFHPGCNGPVAVCIPHGSHGERS